MPRSARKYQLKASLVFHIVNRGILRRDIFHDSRDVTSFIDTLTGYIQRFEFSVYHWCVMHNHYHLVVELKDYRDLSKIIGGLQQVYARRYHGRYKTAGRLFQNRFKSQAIERSSYLLACGRYVERNPVRAGLVGIPWEWPWSSAQYYALGKNDHITTENPEWRAIGGTGQESRKRYEAWLLDDARAIADENRFKSSAEAVGSVGFIRSIARKDGRPRPRRGRPAKIISE